MSVVGQAYVEILPVSTGFASALERQIKTAADKATKSSQGILGSLAGVGQKAALGLVGVTAVVGGASVKMASDFQSAAVHLVTDAGEAANQLGLVQRGMLQVSRQTGTSAMDIVNGMYHIESAGYHGAAGLQILKAAAEGAKVGGADLDTVSKTLTGTMRSYNIPAGQAVNVMNELVAAVGSGDMRMQDLASSLGNVTPIAAAAGLSLAQVTGAVATMTAQNMSAQQATQDVANTIRSLQAPSSSAIHMMAQMGLNANDVSKNLGQRGLTGTLSLLTSTILQHMGPSGMVMLNAFNQSQGAAADLQIELSKMPPSLQGLAKQFEHGQMTMGEWRKVAKGLPVDQRLMMQGFMSTYSSVHRFNDLLRSGSPAAMTYNATLEKMLGGATGLNTALMLTGSNFGEFTKNVNTVADAAKKGGANVDNWAMIQKTFAQQMESFKVTVQDLMIQLGLKLIPVIESVMHAFAGAVTWFENHKAVAVALAGVIGGVLTTTIAAFTAVTMAKMFNSVRDGIKIIKDFGAKTIETIGKIGGFMMDNPWLLAIAALVTIAVLVITHWSTVKRWFEDFWHAVSGFFVNLWGDIYGGFISPLVSGFNDAVGALTGAFDAVRSFFEKWWPILLPLALTLFLGPLGFAVGVLVDLIILHWHTIERVTREVFGAIGAFFKGWWDLTMAIFGPELTALWSLISTAWTVIKTITGAVWDAIRIYFTTWWSLVQVGWTTFISILKIALSQAWADIKAVFTVAWDAMKAYFTIWWDLVKGIVTVAWDVIKGIFTVALDLIEGNWSGAWNTIVGTFSSVFGTIETTASQVWSAFTGFLSGALGAFGTWWSTTWGNIVGIFTTAWSGVSGAAAAIWKGISSAFSDGINTVEKLINSAFINPINAVLGVFGVHIKPFDTASGGGGRGGPGPSIPTIGGKLAGGMARAERGMVVDHPAVLVGEGRRAFPEWVIPSDPMYRARAHALLGSLIGTIGLPGMQSGGVHKSGGHPWWDPGGVVSGAANLASGAAGAVTGAAGSALHWVGSETVGPAIDAAVSAIDAILPGGFFGHMAAGAVSKIASAIKAWVSGHHPKGGTAGGISGPIPTGDHLSLIDTALKIAGVPVDAADESAVNLIVTHESGWNPRAINTTDINAQHGDPSRGLMQTIGATFERWLLPGLPDDIYDPLSNLVAGIRYATNRYGSLLNVPGVRSVASGGGYQPYDSGGPLPPGLTMAYNGTGDYEYVLKPSAGRAGPSAPTVTFGQGAVQIVVHGNGAGVDLDAVRSAAQEGMEEGLRSMLGSAAMR